MDWERFLEDHSIDYVTRGPNTRKGEVSVQCPWCGEDDPSQHLGIHLTTENWGCHRNAAHRGKKPQFLVAALLNCSMPQARLVTGAYSVADPSTLGEALKLLEPTSDYASPTTGHVSKLSLPDDFRLINQTKGALRFWNYLEKRGFEGHASKITLDYELYCANTGRWKDRLIFTFYQDGELVGWTGRALVNPVNTPRYLSSGEAIKRTVFNEDGLRKGGDTLYIVEGPFDALKLDYYGRKHGVRATCVFGTNMTPDQVDIIAGLKRRFQRTIVLFDQDAVEPAFFASDWLHGVTIGHLPDGVKDPGEMSQKQVESMLSKI